MALITELKQIFELADIRNMIGKKEVFILTLCIVVGLSYLLVMVYHGHVQALKGPDEIVTVITNYHVPYGSPTIGVLENGSVGILPTGYSYC